MDTSSVVSIMVQLNDPQWTLEAAHLACAVARVHGLTVIFVKMIAVSHTGWLGTELGYRQFSLADKALLDECAYTAQDYNVEYRIETFQYVTLSDALVQAAAYFHAQILFANLPAYSLPWWRQFLMWRVRGQLAQSNRALYTLDGHDNAPFHLPIISLPPTVETEEASLSTPTVHHAVVRH